LPRSELAYYHSLTDRLLLLVPRHTRRIYQSPESLLTGHHHSALFSPPPCPSCEPACIFSAFFLFVWPLDVGPRVPSRVLTPRIEKPFSLFSSRNSLFPLLSTRPTYLDLTVDSGLSLTSPSLSLYSLELTEVLPQRATVVKFFLNMRVTSSKRDASPFLQSKRSRSGIQTFEGSSHEWP
jgi:hypothetical protein